MAAPETAPASPILTESFQEDPYPVIHSLRKDDPVHWVPLGFWFVTRHDDIKCKPSAEIGQIEPMI